MLDFETVSQGNRHRSNHTQNEVPSIVAVHQSLPSGCKGPDSGMFPLTVVCLKCLFRLCTQVRRLSYLRAFGTYHAPSYLHQQPAHHRPSLCHDHHHREPVHGHLLRSSPPGVIHVPIPNLSHQLVIWKGLQVQKCSNQETKHIK